MVLALIGEAKMVKKTYDAKARLALKISRAKMWWRFEELTPTSYAALKDFWRFAQMRGFRV